jgi:shikimate kinase
MITALIGHRGVGKTTLLRRIEVAFSHLPGTVFKDLDREIEILNRRSIESIFKDLGEVEFRRMENLTFQKLLHDFNHHSRVFIAVGAGYEGQIPAHVHKVWIRRDSDYIGRIFLDRPGLSEGKPLHEWQIRLNARDPRFHEIADEELTLPEGSLHDPILEEHFFAGITKPVPYSMTVLPEHFHWPQFFLKRRAWGLKYLELRDDLLTPDQIRKVRATWPNEHLLYSIRKDPLAMRPSGLATDWPSEFGKPGFDVKVFSLHARLPKLSDTLQDFTLKKSTILKLAVEINNFQELLEGHRWWQEDPSHRAFLPKSPGGRWLWYRQLFGPQMPIHFFREGDGTSLDQPLLWQTLATPKLIGRFAAVLGSPVTQSWTPTFQREYFEPLGIPIVAIEIGEEEWSIAMAVLVELGLKYAAVTSPLKTKAYELAAERTPEAQKFESVNTLYRTGNGWFGHNTDYVGVRALLQNEFAHKAIPLLVWGGGGTKAVLAEQLPGAQFISARMGQRLEGPVNMVWAVGRGRPFSWPVPPAYIQSLVDLNYSEDSPGREVAQLAGCPYKSGETMFIHQGLAQREFWKRF